MELLNVILILTALIGIIAVSLFTFFKNPKSATNKLFFLFSFSLAIYIFFNYLALTQPTAQWALFWMRAVMFIALLINLFFFLLVKAFPYTSIKPTKIVKLAVIATILILPMTYTKLVFQSAKVFATDPVPGNGMPIFLLHTVLLLGGGFIILIKKYRKATGLEKIQIRFFLTGTIFMFAAIMITNVIFVVFLRTTSLTGLLPFYTLIFVLFIGYAIIRHRFLDIRLIVARSVAYTLLVITLGMIYTGVLFIFSTTISGVPIRSTTLLTSGALAFFIAFSFHPLLRYFEKITDKIFYKNRYEAQFFLRQTGLVMATYLDISQLSEELLKLIRSEMNILSGHLILIKDNKIIWNKSSGINHTPLFDKEKILLLLQKARKHDHGEHFLVYDELSNSYIKEIMQGYDLNVVFPLVIKGDLIGGLFLGEKSSGDIYSSEDIGVLRILSSEIAVAMSNALAFQEIKQFNVTLTEKVKQATEKLRHANTKLKELDELKDEFVSLASHELRTPMTAIKSYLWMALNKSSQKLDPEMQKYLDISYQSTERLIRLVNDMLTVSRIERNKIELTMINLNIYELLQQVHDELKIKADEKDIEFSVNTESKDIIIEADNDKLREVFQNLVGNALKFTQKGSITITIKKEINSIKVAVSDTGPGIPKEELPKLFQKFSRIEYSYSNHANIPGTGLGLYISKQIVTLHQGKIEVESKVNVGSTFTVYLPFKHPKEVKQHNGASK